MSSISIIVPVYNEAKILIEFLDDLILLNPDEIIVVDGGSTDSTFELACKYNVKCVKSVKGRAVQMNAGAKFASSDILLFLHADCRLSKTALSSIKDAISNGLEGGCLTQKIIAQGFVYRMIESSGSYRARLSKIFYGDQAIFVQKHIFEQVGGFENVSILEDVYFSRKLNKYAKVNILAEQVFSQARRWQKQGLVTATIINWVISIGCMLGVPPSLLSKLYLDIR